MDFFTAMGILTSGLAAEKVRLNVTSSNLANARTTRSPEGGPYRRRDPVFVTSAVEDGNGFASELHEALQRVDVGRIAVDGGAPQRVHDPTHPDADAKGYVELPNVNMVEEMVNMLSAARSYEANLSAMRALIDMAHRTLNLGK